MEVGIQTDKFMELEVVPQLKAEVELLKHQVSNDRYCLILTVSLPHFSSGVLLSCTLRKEVIMNLKYKKIGKVYVTA